MKVENIKVYQIAMEVGEKVWDIVRRWPNFEKFTLGKQLTKSADSIAANISEGYGRYHYKENKTFLYYARGSLLETKTWLQKALNRKLIESSTHGKLESQLNEAIVKLNRYIKSIGKQNE